MRLFFSWDDGASEDEQLFELHNKYEIPATFFVPTRNREGRGVVSAEVIRRSESKYVSFGGHTQNHTYLTKIPLDEVDGEILSNKQYLEDILGHEVKQFCLPGGQYNKAILEKAFQYYDTVRTADTMDFSTDSKLIKPTFHFYPRGYRSLLGNAARHNSIRAIKYLVAHPSQDYFDILCSLIEEYADTQADITIWGHSWEIQGNNLWQRLEDVMSLISSYIGGNI